MKLKDLIGISLVSLFLFPVILIGIMLAAGVVHIEFGNGKNKDRIKPAFSANDQARQEEAETKQLKAYKALELKEKDLQAQQTEVNRETERLENLMSETKKAKDEIEEHHRKIEELVSKSTEIQDKQLIALAEVYGGMRPDEAAPILLSLEDSLVVRIMRKIPESRSTSKLMAALAALDVKRAAKITTLLDGKSKTRSAAAKLKTVPAVNKADSASADASKVPANSPKAVNDTNSKSPKAPEAKKNGPGGKI